MGIYLQEDSPAMRPDPHIPDDDLVMYLDGELPEPRSEEVARHLAHCWPCRARRAEFERSIAGYMSVHREFEARDIPPARLRAALENEPPAATSAWWSMPPRYQWALSAAALALPVALLWISTPPVEAAGPLPDSRLTPGAVRFISRQQVCGVTPEDEGRLVPADLARRVFQQYRIGTPKPRTYEVDYLISPALGGATAMQNLWPVPYSDGVWTSRVKDALEDHLRTLVCDGKLDLATAQQEIATDWIAAYQRHFRTKLPVAEHARFVKDSPWE